MTVVGSAWVEIKAMTSGFGPSIASGVHKPIEETGAKGEAASGRVGKAFKGMFSMVAQNSQGALAPLMDIGARFEGIGEKLKSGPIGQKMMGIGAAATGAGAAITALGDKETIAFGQLQQSVQNAGGDWETLREDFEKTAKGGEKFGISTTESAQALQTLTDTTHNPKAALEAYQATVDLAAAKHMDLNRAAMLVSRAMEGQTGALKRYGISIPAASGGAKELTKANKDHETAVKAEQQAQNAYTIALDKFQATAHPTKAQIDALNISHQKLTDAQGKAKTTQDILTQAQKDNKSAGNSQQATIDAIQKQMGGQASVSANTFTGHLKAMRVEIEDHVAAWGAHYGPTLLKIGPAIAGTGAGIEMVTGLIQKIKGPVKDVEAATKGVTAAQDALKGAEAATNAVTELGAAADAAAAAGEGAVAAGAGAEAAAESTAAVAGTAADVALAPIIAIGAAIVAALAALGFAAYELYKHWDTVFNALKTAFHAVINGIVVGFHALIGFFEGIGKWLGHFFGQWGHIFLDVLLPFIGIPLEIFHHWSAITGFLGRVARDIWNFLKTWGPVALSVIMPFIGLPILIWQHFGAVKGFLKRAWDDAIGVFTGAVNWIRDKVWHPFWDNLVEPIGRAFGAIGRGISAGFKEAKKLVRDAINVLIHGINELTGGLSHVWTWTGLPGIPSIPDVPAFRVGGRVPGTGNQDSVLARLMPNEFVLSHKHIGIINRLLGPGFLDSLPRFAGGGWVPGQPLNKDDFASAVQYMQAHQGDQAVFGQVMSFAKDNMFGGSIFGDIGGAVTGAAKAAVGVVRTVGAQAVSGAMDAAEAPFKAILAGVGDPWKHAGNKIMDQIHNKVYNSIKGSHDSGGFLLPGGVANNASSAPEAVLTGDQWSLVRTALTKMTTDLARGNDGLHGRAMPLMFVNGDLVVRSDTDINRISSDLYRVNADVARARG